MVDNIQVTNLGIKRVRRVNKAIFLKIVKKIKVEKNSKWPPISETVPARAKRTNIWDHNGEKSQITEFPQIQYGCHYRR